MNTRDVTDFPDIRANDEVVLFGEQRGATAAARFEEWQRRFLLAGCLTTTHPIRKLCEIIFSITANAVRAEVQVQHEIN